MALGSLSSYTSPAARSAVEAASSSWQHSSSAPALNKYTYVAPSAAAEPVSASLTAPSAAVTAISKALAPKAERGGGGTVVTTLAAPSITLPAAGTSTVVEGSLRAAAAPLGLSKTLTRTYAPVTVTSSAAGPVTVTSAAAPVVMLPGSVSTSVGAGLGVTMRAGSLQAPVGGSLHAAYHAGGSLQAPARASLAASMGRPPSRPIPPQRTTESMPDPAAIEQQKATYANSLDMQLQQGTKMLEQQNEIQRQALRQQADEQIRAFVAQVDDELRAQEMNVDQQASLQLIELQQAAHEQRALLEQQANAAVLEYEQKRVQDELTARQAECQRRAQERQNEIQKEVARHREALAVQAREAAQRRETGLGWAQATGGHTSALGAFGQDLRDVVPNYATSEPIAALPSPLSMAGTRGASSYVAPRAASAASALGGTYAACMFTG